MYDNIKISLEKNVSYTLNKVLIKTYLLLSSTIFFSSFICALSIRINSKPIGFLSMILIYFILLFLIDYFKRSLLALFLVFLLTGFLGYYAAPFIGYFLKIDNGSNLIFLSLFLTGVIFSCLSLYSMITRKNFTFLGNFLFVGFVLLFFLIIFNLFFHFSILHLVLSGCFIILSSCLILYDLSSIINNGEEDYINVTVSLYLSIYNMFINFLVILGFISNNE